MKKIYLAIPYSGITEMSFKIANEVTAKLMNEGHVVYSPITHSHSLAQQETLPTTWSYWESIDKHFVEWAEELHLVVIGEKGWELIDKSVGVQAELKMAEAQGKPIKHIHYTGKHLEL